MSCFKCVAYIPCNRCCVLEVLQKLNKRVEGGGGEKWETIYFYPNYVKGNMTGILWEYIIFFLCCMQKKPTHPPRQKREEGAAWMQLMNASNFTIGSWCTCTDITDIHFWIKSHVLYTVVYKWIKDKPLRILQMCMSTAASVHNRLHFQTCLIDCYYIFALVIYVYTQINDQKMMNYIEDCEKNLRCVCRFTMLIYSVSVHQKVTLAFLSG